MSDRISTLTAGVLLSAAIAALSACHSEDAAPELAHPALSLPSAPQPSSLVGTEPVSRSDEKAITPQETVGAASN